MRRGRRAPGRCVLVVAVIALICNCTRGSLRRHTREAVPWRRSPPASSAARKHSRGSKIAQTDPARSSPKPAASSCIPRCVTCHPDGDTPNQGMTSCQ